MAFGKTLKDRTRSRRWMASHVDRLIGFEVLSRAISGDNHPMSQQDMSDRLGVGPDFFALMTMKLRRKHAAEARKEAIVE